MDDAVAADVFGAGMNDNNEKIDNSGDAAPYGGLVYYKCLSKKGVKYWRGYFYSKVRAAMGNDSSNTKSNSITLTSTQMTFTVNEPATGDWRYVKTFDREKDVIAWADRKLSNEAEPGNASGTGQNAGDTQQGTE